jgi:hypothetical protein
MVGEIYSMKLLHRLFIGIGIIISLVSVYHWGIAYWDFGNLCLGILIGLIISGFSYLHYKIVKNYEQISKEVQAMIKWKKTGH